MKKESYKPLSREITVTAGKQLDIDAALQEVQTKIAQVAKRLPIALDPPVVTKTNPEDQPIINALRSPCSPFKSVAVWWSGSQIYPKRPRLPR